MSIFHRVETALTIEWESLGQDELWRCASLLNLAAIEDMNRRFPHAELCFIESGGDNLAATFSPELADLTIYVIDVAAGEKMPRKGGRIPVPIFSL